MLLFHKTSDNLFQNTRITYQSGQIQLANLVSIWGKTGNSSQAELYLQQSSACPPVPPLGWGTSHNQMHATGRLRKALQEEKKERKEQYTGFVWPPKQEAPHLGAA